MLFNKLSVLASLALLAVATPTPTEGTYQCNTGSPQCCQSMSKSDTPSTNILLGLLGIVLNGVGIPIGLTCSPLSVIGVGGGSSCDQNPVCCDNIYNGGLIGINCIPINISL